MCAPSDIKLLFDEGVGLTLAEALRRRRHDAVHVREVERLGLDDESQLEYAAEHRRCFVTFKEPLFRRAVCEKA